MSNRIAILGLSFEKTLDHRNLDSKKCWKCFRNSSENDIKKGLWLTPFGSMIELTLIPFGRVTITSVWNAVSFPLFSMAAFSLTLTFPKRMVLWNHNKNIPFNSSAS